MSLLNFLKILKRLGVISQKRFEILMRYVSNYKKYQNQFINEYATKKKVKVP